MDKQLAAEPGRVDEEWLAGAADPAWLSAPPQRDPEWIVGVQDPEFVIGNLD